MILYIAKNQINSYITASTITDIYYILRKAKGHNDAINFLKRFVKIVKVIGIDEEIINNALNSDIENKSLLLASA